MSITEEIEELEARIKALKEKNRVVMKKELADKKTKFMNRVAGYDENWKTLYETVDDLVLKCGWKDFYYGVLNYQKNCIDSGYKFE